MSRVVDLVSPAEVIHYPGGDLRILLVDTGAKENIVRHLQRRGATVIRAPWNHEWQNYLGEVDGLMLTNGPGDPSHLMNRVHALRAALNGNIPIFGICLGHQLLTLAAGGTHYKMKYGHRSHNQPVRDLLTQRAWLTTQNHGYAMDTTGLAKDWRPWFVNLNDGTNEGIRHRSKPFCSVQFHPEAAAGPRDTEFLFDDFLRTVGECRSQRSAVFESVV
jgi:carbamoyl-phosphate synthase small subunit